MTILIAASLMCVVWAVTASILIAADLQKRGVKVSFILLRLLIVKYLHEYSRITREQTGRVGPLFYHYVIPLNIALILAIVLAIMVR